MTTEVATEQETATFFHSAGARADGGAYPSSMIMRISGGERMMGLNGIPTRSREKEARFHNGVFQTSDPEIIRVLREKANVDPSLTENYESYAARVLTKEQQNRRLSHQMEDTLKENSRLKQKLAEIEGKRVAK